MEFNEKLQQLRKQNHLTQEELAEKLYVSRTAISKWESGRGYPSIDSLKQISREFAISIDDLLSGEELISLAETDQAEKTRSICDLVFGILDCMVAILLFLPFFGQQGVEMIEAVSLLNLTDQPGYLLIPYFLCVIMTTVYGIAELALQNVRHRVWLEKKYTISLLLTILGTLGFIASQQPYAAGFLFFILILKGSLMIKQR